MSADTDLRDALIAALDAADETLWDYDEISYERVADIALNVIKNWTVELPSSD